MFILRRGRAAKHFLLLSAIGVQSARYFCAILNKFEFSGKNFVKASNIELHENSSIGSRDEACGQIDGHA